MNGCHASRSPNFHALLHACQKEEGEKSAVGLSIRFSLILQVSLNSHLLAYTSCI